MSDHTRLGRELAELERTDPDVAAAAASLDRAIDRLAIRTGPRAVPVTRFRKSTTEHPLEILMSQSLAPGGILTGAGNKSTESRNSPVRVPLPGQVARLIEELHHADSVVLQLQEQLSPILPADTRLPDPDVDASELQSTSEDSSELSQSLNSASIHLAQIVLRVQRIIAAVDL